VVRREHEQAVIKPHRLKDSPAEVEMGVRNRVSLEPYMGCLDAAAHAKLVKITFAFVARQKRSAKRRAVSTLHTFWPDAWSSAELNLPSQRTGNTRLKKGKVWPADAAARQEAETLQGFQGLSL